MKSEPFMNQDPTARRQALSALADGDVAAADDALAWWASDPDAREAWHTYHLIGDALRSDDLAVPRAHDAAFLKGVQSRLALEPRVLAPAPLAASAVPSARRWRRPAAVAAGFVMVAGVLVVMRSVSPGAGAGASPVEIAVAPAARSPVVSKSASAALPGLGDPQFQVVDGNLIRDERLDSYLRAHRGGSALLPGPVNGRIESATFQR
jgi:sigma-E factor negative regulatory protein RseA